MNKGAIVILLVAGFTACAGVSIDAVTEGGAKARSVDTVYIGSVDIKSDEMLNIKDSLCREMAFSLKKQGFRVGSFLDPNEKPEQFRYHAMINVFVNRTGDVLDVKMSTAMYFRVIDALSKETILTVKASCNGCTMVNISDQTDICRKIVGKFDVLVKGSSGWF